MNAKAVLRRQCLGSAHQPPAGDHTPAPRKLESSTKATTSMLIVDARPTGAGHSLLLHSQHPGNTTPCQRLFRSPFGYAKWPPSPPMLAAQQTCTMLRRRRSTLTT